MRYLLLVFALLLIACGDTPPTVTPIPPTVTPGYTADEDLYLRQVHGQLDANLASVDSALTVLATPAIATDTNTQLLLRQIAQTYSDWDAQLRQMNIPPRFAHLHDLYLSAVHHFATATALLANDPSSLHSDAVQNELTQARAELQEFQKALPALHP
jgi:hypothetical protein